MLTSFLWRKSNILDLYPLEARIDRLEEMIIRGMERKVPSVEIVANTISSTICAFWGRSFVQSLFYGLTFLLSIQDVVQIQWLKYEYTCSNMVHI